MSLSRVVPPRHATAYQSRSGKTIYTHILSTEYAARVHDPHTYDIVSRDIVQRWTFPLVVDANIMPGSNYRLGRSCVYKVHPRPAAFSRALANSRHFAR